LTAIAVASATAATALYAATPTSNTTRHVVSNDEKKVYIDDQIRFATGLAQRKHYSLAIEEYKRLIKRFKDDPIVAEAWSRLADTLAKKGDYTAAFATFDAFFEKFPKSRIFHSTKLKQAFALRDSGDKKKAYGELQALTANTDAPDVVRDAALFYLAKFHEKDGEKNLANRVLRALAAKKALESPKHDYRAYAAMEVAASLLEAGKFDDAIALFAPLASTKGLSDSIKSRAMFSTGIALMKKSDDKAAADKFAEFAALFPEDALTPNAIQNRLNALFRIGAYSRVVLEAEKAMKNPKIPPSTAADIRCVKGTALAKRGFRDKALAEFEAVLDTPDATPATKRIAARQRIAAMLEADDVKSAVAATEKILKTSPVDKTLARDVVSMVSRKATPAVAEKLLRETVAKIPLETKEGSDSRLKLADILAKAKKNDQALEILNAVAEKGYEKDRPYADLAAATVLENKNNAEAAKKRLEKIVRSKNAGKVHPVAMLRLAVLILKNRKGKQRETAAIYLEQVGKETPGTPVATEARFYQGYMLFQTKKFDKALDIFRETVKAPATKSLHDTAETYLSWTLLELGKTDEAIAVAEKTPDSALANAAPAFLENIGSHAVNQNPKLAKRCFDALTASNDPVARHRGVFRSAKLAVATGDAVKAIEIFKKATDMDADPKTANQALLELGTILAERGSNDEAVLYLEKCLERPLDKTISAKARLALATILSKKPDRLNIANRYAMSVFVLSKNNDVCAKAMLLSAELSIRAGKLEEARSTFEEFQERFPKQTDSERAKKIGKALENQTLTK
jgi:tetratricopeptide (TPR) repeat protein